MLDTPPMLSLWLTLAVLGAPVTAQVKSEEQGDAGRAEPRGASVHRAQLEELGAAVHAPTDDDAELAQFQRRWDAAYGQRDGAASGTRGDIDERFVVFGYLQSETQVPHLRWHALTHVGSLFVGFDGAGNLTGTSAFTGRSSYLKVGGAAETAGVRVILVLANFDDSPGGTIATVMTSPQRRATLINQLVIVLAADSYSQGVSIDLEFSWGTAVRDGVTAFMRELRVALDNLGPDYELSIYTNAIFSASQWNFNAVTGITPAIDYMLYSMYDWASGSTAHAITDFDNCLGATRMHAYLNAGLPPEKLVPTISAYSRRWDNTSVYNGVGSNPTSGGFTDALFDLTLRPGYGPGLARYVRGDEAAWYTWNDGTQRVRTFEGLEGFEVEVRHALSMQDPGGAWSGRRLGGVGFWSLMWMAEFSSIDPRTGGSVARTRTYPHVYQLCQEVFKSPGTKRLHLETFAGLDPRWRDPNEATDTVGDVDGDSFRTLVPSASGAGNSLRAGFDFEGSGSNRAVFAHELLASPLAPTVTDRNAPLGFVPADSRIIARVHVPLASSGYSARMLVIDAQRQVESSPPFALLAGSTREWSWDLTDLVAVAPFATTEPALRGGNGWIDTAGPHDIGFYGFVVEGQGAGSGSFDVESIGFERVDPGRVDYRINEFRYADASAEFVEIYGPSGPVPFTLELRAYDSSDGSVAASFPLIGPIPDDGGGRGYLVLGDPGVTSVDSTLGFAAGRDDLPNVNPSALQLVDAATGHVYDSVVYEAFGGLANLVRVETLGVTNRGWPWLGEVGPGRDSSGQSYTFGRYPDGLDSGRNFEDFRAQLASPGARNGGALGLVQTFDFEAPFLEGYQTYDAPRRVDPASAGLPRSPSGGLAWRCVDAAGGGVIGLLGDAALGTRGGARVTGEVYVPSAAAPAQAIGLGIAGGHGSTFFTGSTATSGYESGFWLVYENRAGVQLANGRPDHPGVWELLHAHHDNMDGQPTTLLASVVNPVVGVTPGSWTTFEFQIRPDRFGGGQLEVRLNGQLLFDGPLPPNAPNSGAFQIGFRENHAGAPNSAEGTWVDHVHFERAR